MISSRMVSLVPTLVCWFLYPESLSTETLMSMLQNSVEHITRNSRTAKQFKFLSCYFVFVARFVLIYLYTSINRLKIRISRQIYNFSDTYKPLSLLSYLITNYVIIKTCEKKCVITFWNISKYFSKITTCLLYTSRCV